MLTASLLWREPTGDAVNSSSGDEEGLGSEALSLLENMAAGLQVRQQASIVCKVSQLKIEIGLLPSLFLKACLHRMFGKVPKLNQ